MLSISQIDDLIEPVIARATANSIFPRIGLVDQAAEYLLQKLDISTYQKQRVTAHFDERHIELEQCQWIDNELLNFFRKYPEATGIEIGCGLSTRFHRLSHTLSYTGENWPRFSWLAIDSYDVNECIDMIFPKIDNYKRLILEDLSEQWLEKVFSKINGPLFLVINQDQTSFSSKQLQLLVKSIRELTGSDNIHLIMKAHGTDEIPVFLKLKLIAKFPISGENYLKHLLHLLQQKLGYLGKTKQLIHFSV